MDNRTSDQHDPKAEDNQTSKADFDRNRDGVYGGLPKTRQGDAPGPAPGSANPAPPDEKAR